MPKFTSPRAQTRQLPLQKPKGKQRQNTEGSLGAKLNGTSGKQGWNVSHSLNKHLMQKH
jgi:hypothetical protein